MLINIDPNTKTVAKHDICDFHKKHPGQKFPGCTCFSSFSQVRDKKTKRNTKGETMTKEQEWKLNQAILNIKSVINFPKAHREVKIIWLTVAENYCNEVAKEILKPESKQ